MGSNPIVVTIIIAFTFDLFNYLFVYFVILPRFFLKTLTFREQGEKGGNQSVFPTCSSQLVWHRLSLYCIELTSLRNQESIVPKTIALSPLCYGLFNPALFFQVLIFDFSNVSLISIRDQFVFSIIAVSEAATNAVL